MKHLIFVIISVSFMLSCQSRGIEMASMDCEKLDKKEERIKCKDSLHKSKKSSVVKKKKKSSHSAAGASKKKSKRKPEPYKDFYKQALYQHWSGNYHQSILLFKKSIGFNPDYAPAHYKMGNTYVSLNQFHDALQAYDEAASVNPKLYEAHFNSGLLHKQQFNYWAAIASFKKAILAKSVFPKADLQLAKLYESLNEKEDATKHYKAAFDVWDARLKSNPHFFEHHLSLERLYAACLNYLEREGVVKRESYQNFFKTGDK